MESLYFAKASNKLIECLQELEGAELTDENKDKMRLIYKILSSRHDVENDFWREVFQENNTTELEIIAEELDKVNKLDIHKLGVMKNLDLFRSFMNKFNVNMDGYEMVIEFLEDMCYPEIDTSKIQIINDKINKMNEKK